MSVRCDRCPTSVTDGGVLFRKNSTHSCEGLTLLVQKRQHSFADTHIAHVPEVGDDERALQKWGIRLAQFIRVAPIV